MRRLLAEVAEGLAAWLYRGRGRYSDKTAAQIIGCYGWREGRRELDGYTPRQWEACARRYTAALAEGNGEWYARHMIAH